MKLKFTFIPLLLIPFIGYSQTQITWTPTVLNTYSLAPAESVTLGDGNGIDAYFRNSGVVVKDGYYYAVNGVHPVNDQDYTSYYAKSLIKADLSSDAIDSRCPYYGSSNSSASSVNGVTIDHEVDMEGLTFGPDDGETYIYVGDEYNYVYQIELSTCEIKKQWNLGNVGISTPTDKGVEAIAYNTVTGNFYVGIQETKMVHEVSLEGITDCSSTSDCPLTLVNSFSVLNSPSGMFYSASDDRLLIFAGTSTNGDQYLYVYTTSGSLEYEITIPSSVGISRGDGIFIDGATAYISDSQGPIWENMGSLGANLLEVEWSGIDSLITSNDEIEPLSSITLFPNPTSDWLEIKAPSNATEVRIWNVTGQLVVQSTDFKELYIDDLAKGIYIMQIYDKNNAILGSKKIIKE